MSVRVIKLGGSLLDWPGVVERLRSWIAAQSAATNVLVVGGGQLVDVVREFDRRHTMRAADAHWCAVRGMEINSRLLCAALGGAVWLDWPSTEAAGDVVELVRAQAANHRDDQTAHEVCYGLLSSPLAILNPTRLLEHDEQSLSSRRLPMSWQVTSDSIAARAAEVLGAEELVLLKSADPPEPLTIERMIETGYVDAYFAEASRHLRRIRYVNLRGHRK